MTTKREIKVSYRSVDRFSKTCTFKTLAGAQKFAQKYVGKHPDLGGWDRQDPPRQGQPSYAVSEDGIGTIRVQGATLYELFPEETRSGNPYPSDDPRSAPDYYRGWE